MNLLPNGNRRVTGAFVTALAALAIAGCGDSDDGSSTSSGSDAKAQFIAAADQLCAESGASTDAAVQKRIAKLKTDSLSSEQVTVIITEVTLPAAKELYEQIGELEPPPDDAADVDAILAAADQAVKEAEADPGALAVITGGETPFDELNQLERDFGLEVCGALEEPS